MLVWFQMVKHVIKNVKYIMLRYVPSTSNLLSVFIINGCCTLSNAFSASIYMIMWFFSLLLLMWGIMFIDLQILYHPCISGTKQVYQSRLLKHTLKTCACSCFWKVLLVLAVLHPSRKYKFEELGSQNHMTSGGGRTQMQTKQARVAGHHANFSPLRLWESRLANLM